MVKIRIALAVDPDGTWGAQGCWGDEEDDWEGAIAGMCDPQAGQQHYWVTLEVPKPELAEPTEIAVKAEAVT